MIRSFFTLSVFLLLSLTAVRAQIPSYDPADVQYSQCESFANDPETCVGFVEQDIWVPSNTTQDALAQYTDYYSIDTVLSNIPSVTCKTNFLQLVCGSVFRECLNVSVTFGNLTKEAFFPKPVCRSVCEGFVSACGPLFSVAGYSHLLPNCSMTAHGYAIWPQSSITVQVEGQEVSLPCYVPPITQLDECISFSGISVCAGSALEVPGFITYARAMLADVLPSWLFSVLW